MERTWCIYLHENKINHKKYIGVTCDIEKRFGKNGRGYLRKTNGKYNQPYFARAILKYGWENFEHIVLEEGLTKEEANIKERDLIKQYETTNINKGYNIREGGFNGSLSLETKEKLKLAMKDKYTKEKNPFWGKHHSEESKRKISEKAKARKRDVSGEKNPMYHYVFTKEQLLKKSLAQKGKHLTEETKLKISKANAPYIYVCVETNMEYYSSKEASNHTGINKDYIQKAAKGERELAGGFHWKRYKKSQ